MKALVLSSGGVDSTTCLGLAVDKYGSDNVIALAITYGQRHTKVQRLLSPEPFRSGNSGGILRRTAAAQRRQAGFDLCAFP